MASQVELCWIGDLNESCELCINCTQIYFPHPCPHHHQKNSDYAHDIGGMVVMDHHQIHSDSAQDRIDMGVMEDQEEENMAERIFHRDGNINDIKEIY